MSLRTTILTSALASAVVLASCGGTNKKKTNYAGDAGAAGVEEEPSGGAGDSGGSAGAAGSPGAAGSAPEGGMGGEAPTPPEGGTGGEAGSPPVVVVPPTPLPTVLFTVAPGATGLPGSAIAATPHPASVIFGSTTANVDPISGTNKVIVTAAQLGIADGDVISAFALGQAPPAHATYAFSIAGSNAAGDVPTRLARSSADHEAPGDVYFSDAVANYHVSGGEQGARFGYNALVADEQTLGISFTPHNEALDDLTGVQLLPSGVLSTSIYFAVSAGSAGLPGTAVAGATPATRGCTVFKSDLAGTNSVYMTCEALGLTDNAQLKGLTIYANTDGVDVLFSLAAGSNGIADSAVSIAATPATSDGPDNVQNNIYASNGAGSNSLRVAGSDLGLLHTDAIDALAVYDRAAAFYNYTTECTLTPSPSSLPNGNIYGLGAAHGLGDHLLLVTGYSSDPVPAVDVVAAYDVKTCELVTKVTMPLGTLTTDGTVYWTAVPLAGWSAADPLKNVEYWVAAEGDGDTSIRRLDAAGVELNSYWLTVDVLPNRLDYDPVHNVMFMSAGRVSGLTTDSDRIAFALPAPGTPNGALPFLLTPIPHPCANQATFSGTDALGNSVYFQYDTYNEYRICTLTPTGELADLPGTWTDHSGGASYGLFVPGVAMYSLRTYPDYVVTSHPLGLAPVLGPITVTQPPNTGL